MKKDGYSKIVTGCGIGCAVIVGIVILSVVGIYTYIDHTMGDVDEIEKQTEQLEAAHGKPEEFIPVFDNELFTSRIKSFLTLRDSLISGSSTFIEAIRTLELKKNNLDESESFWSVLGILGSGFEVIPHVVDYYNQRNDLLLKNEMSLGEYYFFYITSYYSFMKYSPSDGPAFDIMSENGNGIHLEEVDEDNDGPETIIKRRNIEIRTKANRMYSIFLSNYISHSNGSETDKFTVMMDEELQKLKADKLRIPWEDSLPVMITSLLEPHQLKMEVTYSKLLNSLDFKSDPDKRE